LQDRGDQRPVVQEIEWIFYLRQAQLQSHSGKYLQLMAKYSINAGP